uniref:Uncharacterized protein n=1 Tax=Aegilops tauschii subsp. strangulata TaxID=200361 RepID=A0A452Y963_AEGTS
MKLTKVTFALFSLDRTSLYGTIHIQHSSKRPSGTRWMQCLRSLRQSSRADTAEALIPCCNLILLPTVLRQF